MYVGRKVCRVILGFQTFDNPSESDLMELAHMVLKETPNLEILGLIVGDLMDGKFWEDDTQSYSIASRGLLQGLASTWSKLSKIRTRCTGL